MNQDSNVPNNIHNLAFFDGSPSDFWPEWLAAMGESSIAKRAFLLSEVDSSWQVFQQWPLGILTNPEEIAEQLPLVSQATELGFAHQLIDSSSTQVIAAHIPSSTTTNIEPARVLLLFVEEHKIKDFIQFTAWLRLAVTLPIHYQSTHNAASNQKRLERLFDVIRLTIKLGQEQNFIKASILLCNELASRYQCDRVILGWLESAYIRIKAVSNIEQFDHRMDAASQLESVMEESFDQDTMIAWPNMAQDNIVTRNHEQYARTQGVRHLLSLPIRVKEQPEAVFTAERLSQPFNDREIWEINLIMETVANHLGNIQHQNKWFISRWKTIAKQFFGRFWGVEHSLAKLLGLLFGITILVLVLVDWPYRIDGAFVLRSQHLIFMPAPYDGYLKDVYVEIGDKVEIDQPLVSLDTTELVLEEAMVSADLQRYASEVEKARGRRELADMQISQARKEQSAARLELVRQKLSSALILTPMNGIIVEGELKQNLGAPLRKGDLLLKIADIDHTYVEIEITQDEIHEISVGSQGQIAFVGRPDRYFAIEIERIDPVAISREGRSVFIAKARQKQPTENWLRPGMGGTAKVDVQDRSLLWVLTHRTVRYFQRVFWL